MYVTCACGWHMDGPNFSTVQRSHWECDGGLLRSGGLPIVILISSWGPLLAVSTDLLQHSGDIWSRPVTVNHPDTEHNVSTNTTETDYNGVSVRVYTPISSLLLVDQCSALQVMLGVKQTGKGALTAFTEVIWGLYRLMSNRQKEANRRTVL